MNGWVQIKLLNKKLIKIFIYLKINQRLKGIYQHRILQKGLMIQRLCKIISKINIKIII